MKGYVSKKAVVQCRWESEIREFGVKGVDKDHVTSVRLS